MATTPRRAWKSQWRLWLVPAAVLTLVVSLATSGSPAADPETPTSEEQARLLEWYKRQAASKTTSDTEPAPSREDVNRLRDWYAHNSAPQTIPSASSDETDHRLRDRYAHNSAPQTIPNPPSEEVARFVEWYKREGAWKPSSPTPPTADDVARFLAWYRRNGAPMTQQSPVAIRQNLSNEEVARYLEAYRHAVAPPPHAAPVPVAMPVDVQPLPTAVANTGSNPAAVPVAVAVDVQPLPTAVAHPAAVPAPLSDEAVRYMERYRHVGAPTPHALPVVTKLDVQPIQDHNVQTVAAQEAPIVLIPAPPPQPVVQNPPAVHLIPVPPPPPRPLDMAKEEAVVPVVSPPAPLPPLPETPPPPKPAPLPLALSEAPAAPSTKPPAAPVTEPTIVSPFDSIVQQTGCSSCGTGGGLLGIHDGGSEGGPGPSSGPGCACGSGGCVPGRLHQCSACESDTVVGRFLCGVYECICCPDPCYDPHWIPIADAAFFTESARPQTQQSVGWDAGRHLILPDRSEYFWARADGNGMGPNPANHSNPNGLRGENQVNYNDLWLYTEAALGNIGTFIYMPYRSLDGDLVGHAAGFSDMQVGTKTLLFDCELLQIAFEFRTFIPTGNASKGLGTGHVSLAPGLIIGLKVGPETYFQGQVAEWIPLGGDPSYQGALLEYHMSFNQVLYRILPDVPLVGTAELSGWSFQTGEFTDAVNGSGQRGTGGTYIAIGPGLRLFICDKIDFGIGMQFAVTDQHFADQLFRSEFRWRF